MVSEIEIIKGIRKIFPRIGDDAETFQVSDIPIITIDSFVENVHFKMDYFSYYDVGYKSISAAISDIAACGGAPKYALVALGLPKGDEKLVDELYRGIGDVAQRFNVEIIGGDITKSEVLSIIICVIGETKKIIRRSGAKIGDVICVTGTLGSSYAGLLAIQNQINTPLRKRHLNPLPRVKEGIYIGQFANSMIDISDGLTIDISHILDESVVGAQIWRDKLPIDKETKEIASRFSKSARDFAMNGGEDFELLFTIPKSCRDRFLNLSKDKADRPEGLSLLKNVRFTEIGEIIKCKMSRNFGTKCKIIDEEGNTIPIGGFDHFVL